MNEQRRRKAGALLKELMAIEAEMTVLRDGEAGEQSSLMSVFEVQLLAETVDSLGQAINALKGAAT